MKRLLLVIFAIMPLLAFATDEVCPAGYQTVEYIELEYIESTGTQWIDTGVSGVCDVELDAQGTRDAYSSNVIIATSSNNGDYFGSFSTTNKWSVGPMGNFSEAYRNRIQAKISFTSAGILATINNTTLSDTRGAKDRSSNYALFKCMTTNPFYAVARLYLVKIFQNNILVRHFVPVRRLPDGEIGMYDKVEGKFYGNNGTGEFIAGPETGQSFIVNKNNGGCVPCSGNTYKPNAGNESCTKCPTGTFSPIGSTSLEQCARILHVGEYVVYMPLGKRTEHGLCVMVDGKKYCADVYERQ